MCSALDILSDGARGRAPWPPSARCQSEDGPQLTRQGFEGWASAYPAGLRLSPAGRRRGWGTAVSTLTLAFSCCALPASRSPSLQPFLPASFGAHGALILGSLPVSLVLPPSPSLTNSSHFSSTRRHCFASTHLKRGQRGGAVFGCAAAQNACMLKLTRQGSAAAEPPHGCNSPVGSPRGWGGCDV